MTGERPDSTGQPVWRGRLSIVRELADPQGSFVRFLLLGAWNALWSIALYALLVGLGLHYLLALTIVWTAGFVVSYVGNFIWVFRTASHLRLRRNLPRYLALFWGTFAFNVLLLSLLAEVALLGPLLAQLLALPIVVLLNYIGGRMWAFRP